MTVTGHAGSRGCLALPALLLADVTCLQDTEQSPPPPFHLNSILSHEPKPVLCNRTFCGNGNVLRHTVQCNSHEPTWATDPLNVA